MFVELGALYQCGFVPGSVLAHHHDTAPARPLRGVSISIAPSGDNPTRAGVSVGGWGVA